MGGRTRILGNRKGRKGEREGERERDRESNHKAFRMKEIGSFNLKVYFVSLTMVISDSRGIKLLLALTEYLINRSLANNEVYNNTAANYFNNFDNDNIINSFLTMLSIHLFYFISPPTMNLSEMGLQLLRPVFPRQ